MNSAADSSEEPPEGDRRAYLASEFFEESGLQHIAQPSGPRRVRSLLGATPTALTWTDTAALGRMMTRLVRANSEAELYQSMASLLPQVIPLSRASVALICDTGTELEIKGLASVREPWVAGVRFPIEFSAARYAIRDRMLHRWWPRADSPEFEGAYLASVGIGVAMIVPLLSGSEVIGTLNVGRAEREFSAKEQTLFVEIAVLVSNNLERFRAVSRAQEELAKGRGHATRMQLLAEAGRDLSQATTRAAVFRVAAEIAPHLIADTSTYLWIPDHDGELLTVSELSLPGDPPTQVRTATSPIREVLDTGRVLNTAEANGSGELPDGVLTPGGFSALLAVPITAAGQVIAVLSSGSQKLPAIAEPEAEAMTALAGMLSATLDRVEAQQEVFEREQRISHLVDDSPLLMLVVDLSGQITQVSRFGATRLGFDPNELRDKPLSDLYPDWADSMVLERVMDLLAESADEVHSWQAAMLDATGRTLWVRHTARRLGTWPPELLIVCEDVTELRRLADQLAHEATHDPLTGLVNRREFERRLADLAARVQAGVAIGSVCYLDLDHFKLVNDLSGHIAGDALLRRIAESLGRVITSRDLLARIGGDELAVLLENCTIDEARVVADRLRQTVRNLGFTWQGHAHPISVSVGVAQVLPEDPTGAIAMRGADDACYAAKGAGRNAVASSEDSEHERRRDREWVARTRSALESNGFRLAAQVILPLTGDDGMLRFESLIRMADDRQLLSAGLFVPPAERIGLVSAIDEWVVNELLSVLSSRPSLIDRLAYCTVNLSALSVESSEFHDDLVERLREAPRLCPKLIFEITETTALTGYANAHHFVESITGLGCRFALDDFGAGFTTFQHLRHLPISLIKIDGGLVRGLASDPIDEAIVASITNVASVAGIQTVAEFVETPEVAEVLRKIGVDFGQGYELGRPTLLTEFLDSAVR